MNQKIVAVIVSIILVVMVLFPPFHWVTGSGIRNLGYSMILTPPRPDALVNVSQLAIQLFVVLIVGGITFFVLSDKK